MTHRSIPTLLLSCALFALASAACAKDAAVPVLTRAEFEAFTGLHIGYRHVPAAQIAARLTPDFPAGDFGPINRSFGTTGARPELGLVPDSSVVAIVSEDPRVQAHVLAVGRISKSFPVHRYDVRTGKPILFSRHPYTSLASSSKNDGAVTDDPAARYGGAPDGQHQVHLNFVPALIARKRGDRQAFDEQLEQQLQLGAVVHRGKQFAVLLLHVDIHPGAQQCGGTRQLARQVLPGDGGVAVMPKDDPYFAEFTQSLSRNFVFLDRFLVPGSPIWNDDDYGGQYYNYPNGRFKNAIGVLTGGNSYDRGDGKVRIGYFQQMFAAQTIKFAYGLWKAGNLPISDEGAASLKRLSEFSSRLAIAFAGDGKDGRPDLRRMARYDVAIGRVGRDGFVDYAKTAVELAQLNDEGSAALPDENPRAMRYHDSDKPLGPIGDGFAANIVPVLAMAVRDGDPGAQAAWDRFAATRDYRDSKGTIAYQFAYAPPGVYFDDQAAATTAVQADRTATAKPGETPELPKPPDEAGLPKAGAYRPGVSSTARTPGKAATTAPAAPAIAAAPPRAPATADAAPPTPTPAASRSPDYPWLVREGEWGVVPMKNTMRASLPDYYRDLAPTLVNEWPDAAYFDDRHEIAQANSGHAVYNLQAVVYANLDALTYEARNKAKRRYAESEFAANTAPGEEGPDDVPYIPHGYTGYATRPARWGYGPDLFVMLTNYREGNKVNPVNFLDAQKAFGGGGHFYAQSTGFLLRLGNYAASAQSEKLKGWFLADTRASEGDGITFIPGDGKPPSKRYAQVIDQWSSGMLTIDEDRQWLIGINRRDAALFLRIVQLDHPERGATVVPIAFDGAPFELEPDRTGFHWLRGKGIVGLAKLSPTQVKPVRIRFGARPLEDAARLETVELRRADDRNNPFTTMPALANGVYGSLTGVGHWSFLNTGADTPPLQINWPRL